MVNLTNGVEFETFLNGKNLKVIVCIAEWSRLCRSLRENISKFEGNYQNVSFATVDIEKCQACCTNY